MSSISPVSFAQAQAQAQNISAMDKVPQEKLYLPGAYTIPPELLRVPRQEKQSGGFFSFVGKLLLATTALAATAIVIRKKTSMKNIKEIVGENLSLKEKASNIFIKYTDKLYDGLVKCKNIVVDFFTSKAAPKADTDAETVTATPI